MVDNVLADLGLTKEIETFTDSMGFGRLCDIRCPIYREITFEFLSNLDAKVYPHWRDLDGYIHFNIFGHESDIRLEQFCAIFGFDSIRLRKPPNEYAYHIVWSRLASGAYEVVVSKSSRFKRPSFQIIHKLMAHTIFGKG